MNKQTLCILVCEVFRDEIAAVFQQTPHPDVAFVTYPQVCAGPSAEWSRLREPVQQALNQCPSVCLLGGSCLHQSESERMLEQPDRHIICQYQNCASLVADPMMVEHMRHEGDWVVVPGELAPLWEQLSAGVAEQRPSVWGGGVRPSRLVLFDTGVDLDQHTLAQACARRAGLPWERLFVGTGFLHMRVQNIVLEWRTQEKHRETQQSLNSMNQRVSTYEMLFDLIGDMARMQTEAEVVNTFFEVFNMVYAPRNLYYLPMYGQVAGELRAFPPFCPIGDEQRVSMQQLHEEYVWTESGNGFLLRISYRDEVLGVLLVDEFAFAAYREHYLNLALTLVKVCGLALQNARNYEQLCTTLTELQTTTEELQYAKREAEAANRAKSEFLANMSHEIRTPLNAILGMSDLLLDTNINPEQQEFMGIIHSSGHALLSLINDILDFSKIEAGKFQLEYQPFNLRTCLEEAFDLVALKADEQGLNLAYFFDEQIPEEVIGDSTRVRQILFNLLSNAVKFTQQGEVVVDVTGQRAAGAGNGEPHYAAYQSPVTCHLSVRDTGIGIPADRLDRLFQVFSQVDASTTRKYGGTGLGLAISKRLAGLMGGSLWVESRANEGSTFHVTFQVGAAATDGVSHDGVLSDQAVALFRHRRVFIASSYESNRRVCRHYVQSWGMVPQVFETPYRLLETIRDHSANGVIVLDLFSFDGSIHAILSTIQLLRQTQDLVVLLLLPLHLRKTVLKQTDVSVDAVLSRPIKPRLLFRALNEVLQGSRPDGEAIARDPVVAAPPAAPAEPTARPAAIHILLAEDNEFNQKVAVRLLERIGYHARVVENGREVLAALEHTLYDVILMDVQMPEMDGLETTRRIRSTLPSQSQPYIIALTANALQGDRERCLQAGMDDYVSKPMQVRDLQQALSRVHAEHS